MKTKQTKSSSKMPKQTRSDRERLKRIRKHWENPEASTLMLTDPVLWRLLKTQDIF